MGRTEMTTKYEIVAIKGNERFTVAFTARKTGRSLIANLQNNADRIIAAVGADAEAVCTVATRERIEMSDGTVVMFSGRTELDVKGRG